MIEFSLKVKNGQSVIFYFFAHTYMALYKRRLFLFEPIALLLVQE